ncbi:hypothetical protein FCI23_01840 [Actinacidiphila oryziradicis]|uniref:Immune inhibitor A-like metallopeptidase VEG domain-containing protein n=1 Tax=Actinacidiphila oryziradicis TaxID=2571141 RepID=A0A4U0SV63_9ACTN|nr:hypothetical protein FCI23_01840 [Actinacidiphila oryziradicis]
MAGKRDLTLGPRAAEAQGAHGVARRSPTSQLPDGTCQTASAVRNRVAAHRSCSSCPSQYLSFLSSLRCNGFTQGRSRHREESPEGHQTRRSGRGDSRARRHRATRVDGCGRPVPHRRRRRATGPRQSASGRTQPEVSADGGSTWTPLDGTTGGSPVPRDGSGKPALTGTVDAYQDLVYPLDAYAGQPVKLRFRYQTDGGVAQKGFTADAITLTADGSALVTDGAEDGDNGWTTGGFSRVGASFSDEYPQYYIAENRQYVSYDKTLAVGPYNFGFSSTRPNWVEHFPYQNGLLISLWDTSRTDNNTSVHPGSGEILPIDAHAVPETWSDGTVMRNRYQSYDSPFSLSRTDAVTLHKDGVAAKIKSKPGNPVFDDHRGRYYYPGSNPTGGVQVSDTNTRIKILWEARDGSDIIVQVGKSTK